MPFVVACLVKGGGERAKALGIETSQKFAVLPKGRPDDKSIRPWHESGNISRVHAGANIDGNIGIFFHSAELGELGRLGGSRSCDDDCVDEEELGLLNNIGDVEIASERMRAMLL